MVRIGLFVEGGGCRVHIMCASSLLAQTLWRHMRTACRACLAVYCPFDVSMAMGCRCIQCIVQLTTAANVGRHVDPCPPRTDTLFGVLLFVGALVAAVCRLLSIAVGLCSGGSAPDCATSKHQLCLEQQQGAQPAGPLFLWQPAWKHVVGQVVWGRWAQQALTEERCLV